MATIRRMRADDIKDVEYVCRMTAGPISRRDAEVGNRIAKMFSTYYARECWETSFVLSDEADKAVGYLLCEPDYRRFKKIFRKVDVPAITKLHIPSGLKSWFFPIPYSFYGRKYPAHLHIDLLDDYQNKGYGAKMVQGLLEELKEQNVKGIMLITSEENDGAIRFYNRLGFKMLFKGFGEAIMAQTLTE